MRRAELVIPEERSRAGRRRVRPRALAALAALPVLVLVAPQAGAASSNTMRVKAGEYTYKLSGSPKAGWVTIDFDNVGIEHHMMAVVALKKGVTAKQLGAAAASQTDAAFAEVAKGDGQVGSTPDLLSPGYATTTVTKLAAGHYGVLCFVPAADGTPHFLHGMVKVFDVGTPKSSAKPPQDGVRNVTLTDSGITIPSSGIPRHATLKVTNDGAAPHGFSLVKIDDGKSFDDVKAYFDAFFTSGKPEGAAPGELVGGVSAVPPNGIGYLEVDLEPGHYAYVSTEGEAPNDDVSKGLKGEFDVT
jgi:hypothetical protein